MERADTTTYYDAVDDCTPRARPGIRAFRHDGALPVPTGERFGIWRVLGDLKWLTLIFGTMVLLPVWSQTMEDLKRVEDWELVLTKAVQFSNEHQFAQAEPLYAVLEQAAAQFQFPLLLQAKCWNNHAALYHLSGHYTEAAEKYRAAAEGWKLGIGPDSEQLATTLSNLGDVYRLLGQLDKARASLEESIRLREKFGEGQKLRLVASWNNLGTVQREEGRFRPERLLEARTSFEKSIALKRAALGPAHPDVARSMGNLAAVLQDLGDLPGAGKLYLEVLEVADIGREMRANTWNNLGTLYRRTGRLEEARKLFERATQAWEEEQGPNYYQLASVLDNQAELLQTAGEIAGAEPLFRRAMQITEGHFGREHPQTAQSWSNMGQLFYKQGKYPGAEAYFRLAWAARRAALGKAHALMVESMHQLSQVLLATRRFTEAERLLVEQLSLMELARGENPGGRAQRLAELAHVQFVQQRYDAGQQYVTELATVAGQLPEESRREVVKVVNGFQRMLREMNRPKEAARLEGLTRGLMPR